MQMLAVSNNVKNQFLPCFDWNPLSANLFQLKQAAGL
jgi:hypothetical protein